MAVDTLSLNSALDTRRVSPAWLTLTGLVVLSAAIRAWTTVGHVTPRLFPDEYIYASLARSISQGSLTVRGNPAGFPALLEPLLAAPLWLLEDTETVYRLTQTFHSISMSVAAVPVYLIARKLAFRSGPSLCVAALSLLFPAFVYSSYITADAVAYPLALGAIAAGLNALSRPSRRSQVAFLALAGLATFGRVQYVILPAAFTFAAFVVSDGSPRRFMRDFRVTLGLLALPAAALLILGPRHVLGYYENVVDLAVDPVSIARWVATDLMLLAYASGWLLVPAALVGIAFSLLRPQSRAERGFSALVVGVISLLLLEAALYAANGSQRFQERYLLIILPLTPVLFALGARCLTARSARIATGGIACGLVLVAMAVPLTQYSQLTNKQDSPTLFAVYRLELAVGSGEAALGLSLAAAALVATVALSAMKPRWSVALAFGTTALALAAASVATIDYDHQLSRSVDATVGADATWIDKAGVGDVSVLQTPFSSRAPLAHLLFWNQSMSRILRLPEAEDVDAYGSIDTTITSDGRLLAEGRAVHGPVLVHEHGSWAQLDSAKLVGRKAGAALWRPQGAARLALLFAGRSFDGTLASRSFITVWPRADEQSRALRFVLSLPAHAIQAARIDITAPGVSRTAVVNPGVPKIVALRILTRAPWSVHLHKRSTRGAHAARTPLFASAPTVVETSP